MNEINKKKFHHLYGAKKTRISFKKSDFLDYVIMCFLSALVIYVSYGAYHPISLIGYLLSFLMMVVFFIRHGFEFKVPIILKSPVDVFYMIIHKVQNLKLVYFLAIALLLLENYLISLTPNLPHKTEFMHKAAIFLFFAHFIYITAYRTVVLVTHLRERELAREVLMQTSWKSVLSGKTNITLEIFHAYLTGILTHIILIAPWYLVISYFEFSLIFLPVIFAINVIMQIKFLKVINAWFYRDHWLGHNSEFEFVYLHGTHHDAIPSGLIGVAGNGFLEGFMRHILAYPTPFFSPLAAAILYTLEIQRDIVAHQYIPGIFPKSVKHFQEICQHSTHHFGHLEPYGFAIKLDASNGDPTGGVNIFPKEFTNSFALDQELTGFKWDNSRYRRYLELFDKYNK